MQIVININDSEYEEIKEDAEKFRSKKMTVPFLYKIIESGVPLPKGHGRIADIDKVLEEMKATRTYDIPFALERVKPIIEADKTESEE